jgi:hypothetical protein
MKKYIDGDSWTLVIKDEENAAGLTFDINGTTTYVYVDQLWKIRAIIDQHLQNHVSLTGE